MWDVSLKKVLVVYMCGVCVLVLKKVDEQIQTWEELTNAI